MSSSLPKKSFVILFGIYILVSQVILPLASPLRVLGVVSPGEIRNIILPPLLILMVLVIGLRTSFLLRSYLHLVLLIVFIISMLVGLPNFMDGYYREYFSHLFQLFSAFVMLNVGWFAVDLLKDNFWKKTIFFSLISILISTFITLVLLGSGDVGRLYTPAYGFILVAAYSIYYSNLYSVLTMLGLFLSNKRAPMLSVFIIFISYFLVGLFHKKRFKLDFIVKRSTFFIIFSVIFSFCSLLFLYGWAKLPENQDNGLAMAINITTSRLETTLNNDNSDYDITAGRLDEVNIAMSSLNFYDYFLGSGAGWSINVGEDKEVQNIHFTPLSITAVFGAPFALFVYLYFVYIILKSILIKKDGKDNFLIISNIAPYYILGALIHSLFAYSLFIDWLVFFFIGVAQKNILIGGGKGGNFK